MTASEVRLALLGRQDCHLCGPAREALAVVRERTGVDWVEVDVDQDAELREEYGDQVPVVLVSGAFVASREIDPQAVVSAVLAAAGGSGNRPS